MSAIFATGTNPVSGALLGLPPLLPSFAVRLTSQAVYDSLLPYDVGANIGGTYRIVVGLSPNEIAALTGAPIILDPNYAQMTSPPLTPVYSQNIGPGGPPAPLNSGQGTVGGQAWAWQCSVELYSGPGGTLPVVPTAPAFQIQVGLYTGNGTSQTVALPFQPNVVLVKPYAGVGANSGAYMHTGMASGIGQSGGGLDATTITALTGSGFSVGNSSLVNTNNGKYAYIAMFDPGNTYLNWGTYHGQGARAVSITATFGSANITSVGAFLPSDQGRTIIFGTGTYTFTYVSASAGIISQPCIDPGINVVYPATFQASDRQIAVANAFNPITDVMVNGRSTIWRQPDMATGTAVDLPGEAAGNPLTELIKSFAPIKNGYFVVGSNNNVNSSALDYWWFSISADATFTANVLQSGTIVGAGGVGAVVSSVTFQPGFIWTQQLVAGSNLVGYWRVVGGQVGTASNGWDGTQVANNAITAINVNGFNLGPTAAPNGVTVEWATFKGAASLNTPPPYPNPGVLAPQCPGGAGLINAPYFSVLSASSGTPPYTYALIEGALPPGLILNPVTGAITGTPTTLGSYTFMIRVFDNTLSLIAASSVTCSITINASGPNPNPPTSFTPPTAPTVCISLGFAIAAVAARLQDTGNVHWTVDELARYIIEALRVWNAYTQRYRWQGAFSTSAGVPFYDLPTVLSWLRGYNVVDASLVTEAEYHLMEPPTPTVWTGSGQFSLNLITAALQTRRDQFIRETGTILKYISYGVTPDASGRVFLDSTVLAVHRAAWVMTDGTVVPLERDDEWGMTNYAPAWNLNFGGPNPLEPSQSWPTVYSVGVTPPLTVQIAPQPIAAGTLVLLASLLGPALNPASGVLVTVPDDWTWVVKWGAMADLLSTAGTTFDPQRAAYCQARWEFGIKRARQASVVLDGRINNGVARLRSITEADQYRRTWQTTLGTPTSILTMGQNLVGLAVRPNAGPYTIALDVVANMPVPAPGDLNYCINTGIDIAALDAIYDYAQHLAMFKEGPDQLQTSMALYDRFAAMCGVTEKLDQATFPDRAQILQQSVQDVRVKPFVAEPEDTTS